jgi:hypothetical protein
VPTDEASLDRPAWAPSGVDTERPSPARIYDYMLGGSHNFAVDRRMAEYVLSVAPQIRPTAHANRAFLRRAVEYLAGAGIRQFLDLGSGIPTVGNVHEVAQRVAPDARVVYVDIDPVAVAHSRAIVAGDERVAVLQADVRQPETIMSDPLLGLLDLDEPVAVLLVGLLHFIPDTDDPRRLVGALRDAVVPGSYLAISQVATPAEMTPEQREMAERYQQATPVALRRPEEIAAFFDGLELVEPGLVDPSAWRPDPSEAADPAELVPSYAGVGRKR